MLGTVMEVMQWTYRQWPMLPTVRRNPTVLGSRGAVGMVPVLNVVLWNILPRTAPSSRAISLHEGEADGVDNAEGEMPAASKHGRACWSTQGHFPGSRG